MKKKGSKFKSFLQKIRFQYRVSVLNENTLEESWHVRLSRFSVFMFASTFVLLTFILLTILIFTTPIRHYLPGYATQVTVPDNSGIDACRLIVATNQTSGKIHDCIKRYYFRRCKT